ncbi:hypothetical protein ACJD0Z_01275 [Flavobacteriaceae bacterium M23B6Z8]
MIKKIVFLIYLLFLIPLHAQHSLLNADEILKPGEEKEFLFAADKGDEISVKVQKTQGVKIGEFRIDLYPDQPVLIENNIKKFQKNLVSGKRGIYYITVINTRKKPLSYTLEVQSKSVNEKALSIAYKIQKDTTYAYSTSYLVPEKTEKIASLQKEKFYLNSRSNALIKGGKNRIIFPVTLPENTIEWFYVFTASRDETDIQNTLKTFDLAGSLTRFIDQDKSLQNAVASLNTPPGADICDIYLMNEANARLFMNKEDFEYNLEASRENYKSGIVEVSKPSNKTMFLGINNPDNIYGIHVSFEIVAIVRENTLTLKRINIPVITSYKAPYIK